MGVYSEYLARNLNWPSLEKERKKQLSMIGQLRGGRDILAFASAMTGPPGISIVYEDRVILEG